MFKLSSLTIFLLCISARPIDAAIVPASAPGRVYPEVVPGPGLPSLASLNLTSAMLFEMTPAFNSTLHKRNELFDPFCGGGADDTANVDDLIACFNYLQSLRGYECWIPADHDQHAMCTCGSARVSGVDIGDANTSSNCGDVATAVQWVFTYCNSGGHVEGDAAAVGNGNLVVVCGGSR